MAALDWVILVLYCALLIGVGFYFHRSAGGSVEGYFIADRKLPWWVIGLSDSAAFTGGGQAFLMVFFLDGFRALWLMAWVTWVIWMPLVAVLWAKMWRRLGVVTSGEFIERRYGGKAARRYRGVFALYACFAWGLAVLAYVAAWMAATLAPILGWTNGQVLALFGAVTLVYILLSGLFAVAYNDVLQFVLLLVGNTVFALILLHRAGGAAHAWHQIAVLRGAGFLDALPWGGKLTAVSVVALCVQGLFFAGSPYAGEGWTAQRYMAARSEAHAVAGQMFNAVLALVVRLIPFLIMGLAALAVYRPESVKVPAQLWGELVKKEAPAGLFGLLLVGGLGGYMASLSAIVNWAASYLINDLYRLSIRPHASNREYVWMSRLFSAIILIAALAWGAAINPTDLDRWVLFINSALVVFPLPLAWLKWFWWRTNVYGDMVGTLGAFPLGYLVWFGSDHVLPASLRAWCYGATGWRLDGMVPAFGNLDRYPFWAGFSILFVLGWVSILLATLLTRPESPGVLRAFYQSVRPIGWWGPVSAALPLAEQEAARATASRDVRASICGILFYFTMTVAFFSLVGGHLALAAAASALMVVGGWLFMRAVLVTTRSITSMETLHGSATQR